ncbi:MAG: 16S rRNA (cytidine(1402)-2'-O)-methyltransferase [bacterium]|nr:16S rRNA (cytidine(1402)-2'-O)-methyltransferase [bacterium]
MNQKSYNQENNLYLIPTPIGNLDDITVRSLNLLKEVDIVLCEDTRVTGSLLSKYGIKKKLISCHEYNEDKVKYEVVELLKEGKKIGLVTDQGSPIISDPGFNVVNEVIKNNLSVIGLPGATAFVPALISSGIFPSKFLFYGFLNAKDAKQVQELKTLQYFPYTLIFYEAPHRIKNTLNNMYQVFGDRKICLARELSKLYEEYIRGTISELVEQVDSIKGEIVLIVEGNTQKVDYNDLDILEHVNLYIEDGLTEKDAIKKVAKERNVAKSIIYKEYHTRK